MGFALPLLLFAAATGRLTPHFVDDTPSYVDYPFYSLTAALQSIRTPGYPLFLKLCEGFGNFAIVPLAQLLIHVSAVSTLVVEWRLWGLGRRSSWIMGYALTFSCTVIDHQSTVATDCLAMSVAMFGLASVCRWARLGSAWSAAITPALLTSLAIFIRPAYLSMIPWLAIVGLLLSTSPGVRARPLRLKDGLVRSLVMMLIAILPIGGWTLLRGLTVDSYRFLSFGNANLAGITVQLLTPNELESLSDSPRDLVLGINRNAARYDRQADLPAMTLENQWNDLVWQVIVPVNAQATTDALLQEERLAALNHEILTRYPERYARWLLLGMRRAVWGSFANAAMNPPLLLLLLAAIAALAHHCYWGQPLPMGHDEETSVRSLRMIWLVALSYFFVMSGFIVLTSPPLGRFADAAAVYLPAAAVGTFLYRANRSKILASNEQKEPAVAPGAIISTPREQSWFPRRW